MDKTSPTDLSFEQAIARLERIVDEMNAPSTSLDQSLELYEEATTLMGFCSEKIKYAETKIAHLSGQRPEATHNHDVGETPSQ